MMSTRFVRRRWRALSRPIFGFILPLAIASSAQAQINLIYQEGFNDDGDGTRYTMIGRGVNPDGPDGPGAWEHNFNVEEIGLPAVAPARRAAVLWDDQVTIDDYTDDSKEIWLNLVDWMMDGKENATIGFLPDVLGEAADVLAFELEELGHTVSDFSGQVPLAPPEDFDLVIQTSSGGPSTPTALSNYPVPVISYLGGNHDDELISSIGAVTTGGPQQITVVEANAGHPVLGGRTGAIDWVDPFIVEESIGLQGVGISTPAGSTTLATYIDPATEIELPAILLIEEGDPLLGAFKPTPEGTGYIIGGDLNLDLDGSGTAFSETMPRVVELNPVDVSGESGVKVAVALAATTVDFESPDFLRISYGEDTEGEFVTLAQFDGMAPGVLINPDLGALNADEFLDFTFEIPDDVENLIVKIEAYSTFPNEVMGIDNIRIFTGEEPAIDPLDCNMDGAVDVADLDCANAAGITSDLLTALNLLAGDIDGMGGVGFPDFLVLSANFGNADLSKYTEGDLDGMGGVGFPDFLVLSANFGMSAGGAAAAVPEPTSMLMLGLGGLLLGMIRRRR